MLRLRALEPLHKRPAQLGPGVHFGLAKVNPIPLLRYSRYENMEVPQDLFPWIPMLTLWELQSENKSLHGIPVVLAIEHHLPAVNVEATASIMGFCVGIPSRVVLEFCSSPVFGPPRRCRLVASTGHLVFRFIDPGDLNFGRVQNRWPMSPVRQFRWSSAEPEILIRAYSP
ncbi:GM11104 [Drosophila sechellia]|uniref:GM11104 n=1 Tax=Drosophila sechellia TaxID=7238 RepID=B4ILL1_DROSE|nr:GM11104 [Drosophila sechellia]